jgi:hypothetical protein
VGPSSFKISFLVNTHGSEMSAYRHGPRFDVVQLCSERIRQVTPFTLIFLRSLILLLLLDGASDL